MTKENVASADRIDAAAAVLDASLTNLVSYVKQAITEGCDIGRAGVLIIDERDPFGAVVLRNLNPSYVQPTSDTATFGTAICLVSRDVFDAVVATYRDMGGPARLRALDEENTLPVLCMTHGGIVFLYPRRTVFEMPKPSAVAALRGSMLAS